MICAVPSSGVVVVVVRCSNAKEAIVPSNHISIQVFLEEINVLTLQQGTVEKGSV